MKVFLLALLAAWICLRPALAAPVNLLAGVPVTFGSQTLAGNDGDYRTRAFLGDYNIIATKNGKTATVAASVTKNGDGKTVVTVTL